MDLSEYLDDNEQRVNKGTCVPADHQNNGCVVFHDFIADGSFFTYTRHEPVGVCGQIIPVSIKSPPTPLPPRTHKNK